MALSIFEETFASRRITRSKANNSEATREYLADATSAVQSVVDTLRAPGGDRFIVSLSNQVEAFTRFGERKVVVSHQPLFDKGLRMSTACTVMTGLVFHEVGHTLYTFPDLAAIQRAFGKKGDTIRWNQVAFDALAYTIINIGDDARLEARLAERLPVASDIFPTTLHWVAMRQGMVGTKRRWLGSGMKLADRVNFAGVAMRYPWTQVWHNDPVTRAERLWWQAWRDQYIAIEDDDSAGRIALVRTALSRLRDAGEVDTTTEPEPEPETDEPESSPADDFDREDEDEDEDEDGEPGDGEDEDDDGETNVEDEDTGDHFNPSVEDEDADDDEPGEGASDEDEDGEDEGEGETNDGTESEGEGNPTEDEADGEGSPTDIPDDLTTGEGDASDDGEPDDDGSEAETVTMTDPTEDKPFDRDNAPQDFDAHDLQGSIDALNSNNDGDWQARRQGELLQTLLNEERTIDRVKSGEWGTARVQVADPMARIKQVMDHRNRRY